MRVPLLSFGCLRRAPAPMGARILIGGRYMLAASLHSSPPWPPLLPSPSEDNAKARSQQRHWPLRSTDSWRPSRTAYDVIALDTFDILLPMPGHARAAITCPCKLVNNTYLGDGDLAIQPLEAPDCKPVFFSPEPVEVTTSLLLWPPSPRYVTRQGAAAPE